MGGCGRGICIWLETIILENALWLHVVIVWLNDLRLAGVKRCMEMNKGMVLSLTAAFRVTITFIHFRGYFHKYLCRDFAEQRFQGKSLSGRYTV